MAKDVGYSIAQVYAQALHGAAGEREVLLQVEQEIRAIQEIFQREPRLTVFLATPAIRLEEKRRLVLQLFKEFSPITINFLTLLIAKRRVGILDRVVEAYHEHCNEQAGIVEVELRTARKLSGSELERLKTVLKARFNKLVAVKEYVRPELLGGFVLTLHDRQWNGSLSHHLSALAGRMQVLKGGQGVWSEGG